jgi:hypothetical protein
MDFFGRSPAGWHGSCFGKEGRFWFAVHTVRKRGPAVTAATYTLML